MIKLRWHSKTWWHVGVATVVHVVIDNRVNEGGGYKKRKEKQKWRNTGIFIRSINDNYINIYSVSILST